MPTSYLNDSIKSSVALTLISINLLSVFVSYIITICLARSLSHARFEEYIGAIATLTLLASIGEAGFGKYSLKLIPILLSARHRKELSGFLQYAMVATAAFSTAIFVLVMFFEVSIRREGMRHVILLALSALPLVATYGFVIDSIVAYGMPVRSTLIARVFVPTTTLGMVVLCESIGMLNAYTAVGCYCVGSALGMLAGLPYLLYAAQQSTTTGAGIVKPREWTSGALSFFGIGFLTVWFFKAPLVIPFHLPYDASQLALLAPAFEIGTFILLVAKSTDKYLQPSIAVILANRSWDEGTDLRRRRFLWVSFLIVIYLVIVFVFGRQLLHIYGTDFVASYHALCITAVGTSTWALFSLTPSVILFAGYRKSLIVNFVAHGIVLAGLMMALLPSLGNLGVALSYTLAIISLSLTTRHLATQIVRRLQTTQQDAQKTEVKSS